MARDTVSCLSQCWILSSSPETSGSEIHLTVGTTHIMPNSVWISLYTCVAVYPSGCCLKLVAVSDSIEREARIDFWDDVYG